MKKIKIGRSDILYIAQSKFKSTLEEPTGNFDYNKWVDFIESHKDYFIWYEDTEDGTYRKNNMDNVPDWAREGISYQLNKAHAYSTNKMTKNPKDIRVVFSKKNGTISIDLERKPSKTAVQILLEMAKFLNGKLFRNENKEIESIEQVE